MILFFTRFLCYVKLYLNINYCTAVKKGNSAVYTNCVAKFKHISLTKVREQKLSYKIIGYSIRPRYRMFSKPSFMTANAWVFSLLIYEYVYIFNGRSNRIQALNSNSK